ncbi:hypothetical protein GPL17_29635 [Bradyrhizobium yuanmingense]|nr:hypothetical protein [Bradyrhizobium yuanmingense]
MKCGASLYQPRHCEERLRRSNPDCRRGKTLDCFASLAMTAERPPYRIGGAYCTPPAFHSWFMPRGIFSFDFSPMLRSYISP